jgi:hypothetical protein
VAMTITQESNVVIQPKHIVVVATLAIIRLSASSLKSF